ncbi:hypothetical protein BFL43_10425 [Williamsia sp. 1135]|nr:hypothetical protein BFL43_10425 [Williamsia sp. 1135]
MASGHLPGSAGLVLLVVIGVAAGALAHRLSSMVAFVALLTGAQLAGHTVLSLTADPMAHAHSSTTSAMATTHLVAIPVCALLIAGSGRLYSVITSVIRTLRFLVAGPITDLTRFVVTTAPQRRPLVGVLAPGGVGLRGPPAA